MYHSTELHRISLHVVENDTKARAFCGPTAVAAITGQPISVVRDACRMARHGSDWPTKFQRAPRVKGMMNNELATALRILGFVGRWIRVSCNPTSAAWLEMRTAEQRSKPCVINVTRHYVTVSGYEFVDTFTKGEIVDVDEAPGRRKRVQHVFIVSGQIAPLPVVSKQPAVRSPGQCVRTRYYADFAKYARSLGTTYQKEKGDDELEIRLKDGRRLFVTHSLLPDDWCNAQRHLEDFVATPDPDPAYFEELGEEAWGSLWV